MALSKLIKLTVTSWLIVMLTPSVAAAQSTSAWAGPYLGIHGGILDDKTTYPQSGQLLGTPFSGTADVSLTEGFGGVQAGYNWALPDRWVIGLQADYSFTPSSYSSATPLPGIDMATGASFSTQFNVDHSLRGVGTIRATLGYDLDDWLVYATGGYAYGRQKYEVTAIDRGFSQTVTDNASLSGWTVGAGVGYRLGDHLSLLAEYLYMDFGTTTIYARDYNNIGINAAANVSAETRLQQFRLGLNYRF